MGNLIENRINFDLNKARTGRYVDNAENKRLHRVGQEYENKGGREEDGKSFEKKYDNSRTIQALESKIEQMKKNKRIFVEQGGEVRYNRALETLQSKLDSAKGEERKESVRDKASEKKEKTDSDYEKVNEASRKRTAQKNKKIDEAIKDGAIPVGNGSVGKIMSTGVDGTLTVSFTDGKEEWNDKVQPGSSIYWALFDSDKFPREAAVRRRDYLMGLYHETKSSASAKAYKKEIDRISEKIGKSQEEKDMEADRKTEGKSEEKEPFTRVKFDDLPNSGKVNLKKYLSGKRREKIDSQWKDAGKISDADLKKMEAGLVKKFNDSFDSSSKSQRAEDLYNIMKVKGELQSRGKENKGE